MKAVTHRITRMLFTLCAVALLTDAAIPARAQSPAVVPITIAWAIGYAGPQIPVASAMGLWKAAGTDPKIVTFATGPLAFEALIGGQVDFMTTAELPAVTAAMRNQQFTIVADLSRFHGNRIVANFPVPTIASLAGKKIGTVLGTSSQFLLESDLKSNGVKAEILNVAPSDVAAALARGDIDAALPFVDVIPLVKKTLGDRYHEIRIPEETHFVLIASRDMATKRPEIVRSVLSAMLGADKAIKANPTLAQTTVSQAMQGLVSADQLKAAWPDYDFEARLDERLPELMTTEGQWIAAGGMIKNVTPTIQLFRSVIDDRPLKAISSSRVTLK